MLSDHDMKTLAAMLGEIKIKPGAGFDVLDVFHRWFGDFEVAERSVEHIAMTFLKIAQDYDAGSWEGD